MEHYYTNSPTSEKISKSITAYIKNKEFKFVTSNGVFSKERVDFGTKTMLESFFTNKANANVCDLGCGYGVVTIFLASLYPNFKFSMIDVNERSLELSSTNISLNSIKNKINIIKNNCLDNIVENYDIVLTNPPIRAGKEVVYKMIKQSYELLNNDGELWVVIQKKQGMDSCKKFMNNLFDNVEIITKNKGYYVLKSIKYI